MQYSNIIVAVIAATPTTLMVFRSNRIARQNHKILHGNGKGNVSKMLEKVLEWEGIHALDDEVRFARLEAALKNTARRAGRQATKSE